jgi:hypothetical protein
VCRAATGDPEGGAALFCRLLEFEGADAAALDDLYQAVRLWFGFVVLVVG